MKHHAQNALILLNPNNFNSSVNLVNETLNSQLNQQEGNDSDDDSDDVPELESDDDVPELESDTDSEMPELEDISDNQSNNTSTSSYIQFHGNNNLFTHGVLPPPASMNNSNNNLTNIFNSINDVSANSFLQSFLDIMNLQQQQNMEDVRATLSEDGEKEIKHYKLKEKIDGTCSVCMMELEKDQEVSELKCKHVFHKDCIMKWLKEYNYKCPICRAECGKPKFNLGQNES